MNDEPTVTHLVCCVPSIMQCQQRKILAETHLSLTKLLPHCLNPRRRNQFCTSHFGGQIVSENAICWTDFMEVILDWITLEIIQSQYEVSYSEGFVNVYVFNEENIQSTHHARPSSP